MWFRNVMCGLLWTAVVFGQAGEPEAVSSGWPKAETPKSDEFVVPAGVKIPLSLMNSVSTKHSAEGDTVYLETIFPILANGRIVIPPGSYVTGTITQVRRPGRVKGRGEMFLRFDSLTLPNGVTRDFRARVAGVDGSANQDLDRGEGAIKSEGNKSGDAQTIGEAASAGLGVGAIAGGVSGQTAKGIGIGAAAGAAAGLLGVMLSRGPDVVLARGTTLEMVMDRELSFTAAEIDFSGVQFRLPQQAAPAAAQTEGRTSPVPGVGRRSGGAWPY